MRLGLALGAGFQSALNTFGTVNDLADKMDERDADKRVRDALTSVPGVGSEYQDASGQTVRMTQQEFDRRTAAALGAGGRSRDVQASLAARSSASQLEAAEMERNRRGFEDAAYRAMALVESGDNTSALQMMENGYNRFMPDGVRASLRIENGQVVGDRFGPNGQELPPMRFENIRQAAEMMRRFSSPQAYEAHMNRAVQMRGQDQNYQVGMAGVAAARAGIDAANRRQTESLNFQAAEAAAGRIFTADQNNLNRTFQTGLQAQSQQFQSSENAANRTFQRDERLGNQDFQRGENNDNRTLTARGLGIQEQQAGTQARVADATIPLTQEQTRAARRGNDVADQVQATINEFSAIARIPPNRRTPEQQDRARALASDIGTRDAGRLRVVKIKDADGTEREVLVNPYEHIANSGVSAQLMQFRREMDAATPEQRPAIIDAVRREIGVERYNRDFLPAVIDYVMPPPAPPQSGQRGQRGQSGQGGQGGQGVQGGLPVSPQVRSAFRPAQTPTTPGLMSPPDLERWLTLNPPPPPR